MVPGNHDCNFAAAGDARPTLLSSFKANFAKLDLNGETAEQILKVQDGFFEFERLISGQARRLPHERVSWTTTFDFEGKRILVRCLNTALCSSLTEKAGELFFPPEAIPLETGDADFAVTVFHHPYGWLNADNSKQILRRIESVSDLVLTGHEHDGDFHTRLSRSGEETGYVEGAALQGADETGFALILIDLEAHTNQIFYYQWAVDMFDLAFSTARVFTRKFSLIEGRFENNSEFLQYQADRNRFLRSPEC